MKNMNEQEFRLQCNELADAIELGGTGLAEIVEEYWEWDDKIGAIIGVCALGSAYLYRCGSGEEPSDQALVQAFPVLDECVYWPGDESRQDTLFEVIITLNDHEFWLQKDIAAWVRIAKRVEGKHE